VRSSVKACYRLVPHRGFSLIELMVVMGVLAILLTVGAPAFMDLIRDNRLLSEVYGLRATLNNARTEALTQRSFVTVCESDDGRAVQTAAIEVVMEYEQRHRRV